MFRHPWRFSCLKTQPLQDEVGLDAPNSIYSDDEAVGDLVKIAALPGEHPPENAEEEEIEIVTPTDRDGGATVEEQRQGQPRDIPARGELIVRPPNTHCTIQ